MVDRQLSTVSGKSTSSRLSDTFRQIQKVKVIMVGDVNVGKTCLTIRFTKDSFEEKYRNTVGASFLARAVDIPDKTVIFQIWDTAGQERFHSLIPMYLRDAKAAIVVYDSTCRDSYQNVKHIWLQKLFQYAPDNIRVAIVANKVDLEEKITVSSKEASTFAHNHGFLFMETSAKTGHNVEKLFYDVAHLLGDTLDDGGEYDNDETERKVQLCTSENSHRLGRMKKKCCSSS